MEYPYIYEILKQLLSDTFSVFCGAGATADATNCDWKEIFSNKTQDFYNAKCSEDIYFLADLEKQYYNNDFLNQIVRKLTIPTQESTHIKNIINLNINQIWTTNYDEIIEDNLKKTYGIEPTVLATSQDLLTKNLNGEYIIYKLNGTVTDLESMVLTKSDFFDYFKKQRLFFELLKRQLVLDSFIFIGYSFKDDLVLNALREIKSVFPQNGKTHYRLINRNDYGATELEKEYFEYEKKYFYDKYRIQTIALNSFAEYDDYLKELYRLFCNHNVLFCGSFRSIDNDLRVRIEQTIDAIVEKLYLNDFNIYSGNGRGLGEIIVARTVLHKYKPNNRFVNRPLIFTGDDNDTKKIKNERIEKDCNTMIILCGQDDSLVSSQNVKQQFNDFNALKDKIIIPIPTTQYAAKEIFDSEVYKNSYTYKLYSNELKRLSNLENPNEIAECVMSIILRSKKEPS